VRRWTYVMTSVGQLLTGSKNVHQIPDTHIHSYEIIEWKN